MIIRVMNYHILQENGNEIRHEILLLKNEIQSMKNDNNWLWLKHTGYNVLFIVGVTTIILSSIDFEGLREGLRDEIKKIDNVMENLWWSYVNQSIYVIDGKIIMTDGICYHQ